MKTNIPMDFLVRERMRRANGGGGREHLKASWPPDSGRLDGDLTVCE